MSNNQINYKEIFSENDFKQFENAKNFTLSIINTKLDKNIFKYHNRAHTEDFIIPNSIKIGTLLSLNSKELLILGIAAAFHDVGCVDGYKDHEKKSAEYANSYINYYTNNYFNEKETKTILNTIKSTDISTKPLNIYERIIRDADLSYFGEETNSFIKWNNALYEEALKLDGTYLHSTAIQGKTKWIEDSIKFIENHCWFTKQGTYLFDENKQKNIVYLKFLIN